VISAVASLASSRRGPLPVSFALAYLGEQEITGPTPEYCEAALDSASREYRLIKEREEALIEETEQTERLVAEHTRSRDHVLNDLVCNRPEFLSLFQRRAELWIELRSITLRALAARGDQCRVDPRTAVLGAKQ
jgi:hypothetical protein